MNKKKQLECQLESTESFELSKSVAFDLQQEDKTIEELLNETTTIQDTEETGT